MVHRLVCTLALLIAPAALAGGLTGCASDGASARFENEDVPKNFVRVRQMEDYALEMVERGNQTRHPARRGEYFDRAINALREARLLYEDELIEEPGTPARQATIEREMERLSDHIARIHKERPAVQ